MAKKNFTISTVATAPSPATSGTSLVVASGDGSLFAVNEPAIVFPVNDQPLVANAEIVMVTNVATDTLTITRTQESTSARTIVAGDIIIQGITAKDWNDLITLVAGKITAFADPNADRIVFWDDSAGAFAALTASTGLTLSGTTLTVRAASETATGIVERATDAEFTNGTDTTRFINTKQAASVAQTMTNKTLTSPVLNTGVSGTAVLDEDDMASNSATQLATQQSIKAYVDGQNAVAQTLTNKTIDGDLNTVQDLPYSAIKSTSRSGLDEKIITGTPNTTNLGLVQWNSDGDAVDSLIKPSTIETGWVDANETWTYASADDPTFTFTVAADVTTKYSAGMKIKLTQGTVKYFIITAVSTYSGGNTTITVYGGTDYDLANSAISANAYSMMKSPQGFPMSPAKWTVVNTTAGSAQSSPTSGTYYNVGGTIVVPVGVWKLGYDIMGYIDAATTQFISFSPAYGTTSSSSNITGSNGWNFGHNTIMIGQVVNEIVYTTASKITLYLNACTNYSSINTIQTWNYKVRKYAVCAYL